jgi:hypothetical protein
MPTNKYDSYFINEPFIDSDEIKKRLVFNGVKHFPGLNYWFRWNCFTKDRMFRDPPHSHDFDQVFHFMGGDPMDLSDFGAEIEFHLGGEKHIFNRTTLVYVPKGMEHCPIYVRNVTKPIMFINVAITGDYQRFGGADTPMKW